MSGVATRAAVSPSVALDNALSLLPRDAGRAERQVREILKVLPDDARALFVLGAARRRQGDPAGARDALERVAAAHPASAYVQYEIGLTLAGLGEGELSLAALRRARALQRDLPNAWLSLSDQLALAGDAAVAIAAPAEPVRPAAPKAALQHATELVRANRWLDAVPVLLRHLHTVPDDVAALRMLADALVSLNRKEAAEAVLARCVALAPANIDIRYAYAAVLYHLGRPEEAITHVEMVLAATPDHPQARFLLALCLILDGDYARAAELAGGLARAHPDEPGFELCLGQALRILGQSEAAVAAFRRALAVRPGMGEAWWCLADMKAVRFASVAVAELRRHVADATLSVETRVHLHYGLGKTLEDRADWAQSFAHYAEGARLHRARSGYDADLTTATIAAAVASLAGETAEASGGADSAVPIFIVGLPRSGSTLVEQILASHRDVEATAELPYMIHIAARLQREEHRGPPPGGLGAEYLARAARHRRLGRRCFIDKMPGNFLNIGLIRAILPQAKILDVRRHPMAAGFANFKQLFSHGQDFSYALADIGRYYRDYVGMMAQVDRLLPGTVHRVVYEDLVADPEGEIRRLLDYCGLPFDPACLRHWEGGRPIPTHSSEQARRPIFRDGLDRWKHYTPWLGPLEAALGPALHRWRGQSPRRGEPAAFLPSHLT